MKKKVLAAVVAAAAVLSLAGCGDKGTSSSSGGATSTPAASTPAASTGGDTPAASTPDPTSAPVSDKVFDEPTLIDTGYQLADGEDTTLTIYAWNDEFKGFFEKYYKVPDGVKVEWVVTPSENNAYQDKLDKDLDNGVKIDIFLAEADYIKKYVEDDCTLDVSTIGFKNASTIYNYTAEAVTDSNGKQKGMSFQCCPAGLIYRRSIAKEVIGSDDPAKVQEALSTWDKFNDVAAKCKEQGFYMTPCPAETYRTFSNNFTGKWVDDDGNVRIDPLLIDWIKQAKDYSDKGYTIPEAGVWSDPKNAQMFSDGKTLCFFGPAWYYNFSMGNAYAEIEKDGVKVANDKNTEGDWGLCVGPQSYFWGGTWLLACSNTDNPGLVADVMDAFQSNTDILNQMVKFNSQFVNNQAVNAKTAADTTYGNKFLGDQNDWAIFSEGAKNISMKYTTGYDQSLNEQLQSALQDWFTGSVADFETAWGNYVQKINEMHPELKMPAAPSL